MSPAVFRLFESDRRKTWAGARAQILYDNKLATERAAIKVAELEAGRSKKRV
jgi:hypothetical protein